VARRHGRPQLGVFRRVLRRALGTLFGAGGPPYAIYLSHRPLTKEQFRATMTLTTIFSIGLRLIAFA